MVHALSEATRVLVRGGFLLDLRPLASPPGIEVFAGGSWVEAGTLDGSPGIADDEACRKAWTSTMATGAFSLEAEETFTSTTYWDSAASFRTQATETGFRRFLPLGERALTRIDELMRGGGSEARIRLEDVMTVARYRKT